VARGVRADPLLRAASVVKQSRRPGWVTPAWSGTMPRARAARPQHGTMTKDPEDRGSGRVSRPERPAAGEGL